MRTSIEDLAKFTIAYMNGGLYKENSILKKSTIDKIFTPQLSEGIIEDQDQGLG